MPILGSFGAGSGKGFGLTSGGAPDFICATGGTVTESGDFRIHTFTGPGSFVVNTAKEPSNANVDYLVVAGGGSGAYISGGEEQEDLENHIQYQFQVVTQRVLKLLQQVYLYQKHLIQ